MKNLAIILLVFITGSLSAQDGGSDFDSHKHFKLGVHAGIPTGGAADLASFEAGLDAYLMFGNIDSWINLGVTAGVRNFFGDEIDILGTAVELDDFTYVPVGGAARVKLFGIVEGGADIGYAFGISDGADGVFWVRPVVGIDIADTIEIFGAYDILTTDDYTDGSFTSDGSFGSLQVGILFEF